MTNGDGAACQQVLETSELGGGSRMALHLADFVRRRGRPSRVWLPGEGPALDEARALNVSAHTFDQAAALGTSRLRAALVNGLLAHGLRRLGRGLVHVHSPGVYGGLRHGLRWAGVTRVVHLHSMEPEADLRWALRPAPELVITCNRLMRDLVARVLGERAAACPVVAVANAIDLERFAPGDKAEARRRVGAPPGVPLLLMLANLAPIKGQETAIRAAALLKSRGRDALLWMAGTERDGRTAYTGKLKALIAELGVGDRAVLLGERRDAADLLRASDVFLLPSSTEGMPLSLLEAQATRVPAVAAPVGGVPEVVADGATGFLVPQENAAGYADAVARLLSDRELAGRFADRAYERVTRENDWPTYCRRIEELYGQSLRMSGRGR